jgi:hypothetical protein
VVFRNIVQDSSGVQWWTRRHPYRLVIFDACFTAKTAHWASSFGIGPDYQNDGTYRVPAQAFAGFSTFVYGPGYAADWVDYGETYTFIFSSWMSGRTLEFCLTRAMENDPIPGVHLNIPFAGGPPTLHQVPGKPWGNFNLEPILVIYMYKSIKRVGFQ